MEVLGANDQTGIDTRSCIAATTDPHASAGVDESLEIHIARLQHVESELCMVSEDPEAVHASLTTKLVTSVNDDYVMAVTMR